MLQYDSTIMDGHKNWISGHVNVYQLDDEPEIYRLGAILDDHTSKTYMQDRDYSKCVYRINVKLKENTNA